jgi:hypothetical protein
MKLLALVAAVAAAAAGAAPPVAAEAGPPPTVVATPSRAAAQPVALTLKLHYEMVCGRPGKGPLVVTLPSAMRVPSAIARGAVLLQGKAPPSVDVAGHVVTIGIPVPTGISCFSITMGTLATTFTRAARLGAPMRAGTYPVAARIGRHSFTARLSIGG